MPAGRHDTSPAVEIHDESESKRGKQGPECSPDCRKDQDSGLNWSSGHQALLFNLHQLGFHLFWVFSDVCVSLKPQTSASVVVGGGEVLLQGVLWSLVSADEAFETGFQAQREQI